MNMENTCQICYEPMQEEETCALSCQHRFCKECFSMHLEALVGQRKLNTLICPQFGCGKLVDESFLKQNVSEENFKKYERFQNELKVQKDKNLFFCVYPDCPKVLNKKEMKKINWTCDKCTSIYCKGCLRLKEKCKCNNARNN